MNNIDENDGYILGCQSKSGQCHYRCCDQSKITSDDFCQENAILLYPGEWEAEKNKSKKHITISDDQFYSGKLGYCDKDNFDQSKCNPLLNFKPLDCKSYPFFPIIVDGKIKLTIDSARCPLSENIEELRQHFRVILSEWIEITENNELVRSWIKNINLTGYKIVDNL